MKYRKQLLGEAVYFFNENKFYYYMCLSFSLLGLMFGLIRMKGVAAAEIVYGSFFGRVFLLLLLLYGLTVFGAFFDSYLNRVCYAAVFFGGFRGGVALFFLCAFGGVTGVLTAIFLYLIVIVVSLLLLSTSAVIVLNHICGCYTFNKTVIKEIVIKVSLLFALNILIVAILSAVFSLFTPVIIIKF